MMYDGRKAPCFYSGVNKNRLNRAGTDALFGILIGNHGDGYDMCAVQFATVTFLLDARCVVTTENILS